MEYVLTTKKLCKHYRKFQALDNLDLHVEKGAIYGLVGKNGSGKTTLIRIITGLQHPSSGEFTLFGVKNTDNAIVKARRRTGAIVESPSPYLELSAQKNLETEYDILGLPSYDGIEELLAIVGLENAGNKKVKNFSLGMKQRLAIAMALCSSPDFLVLDEPINGLDPEGIVELRELILKLNREKDITVLISSHILGELSKLATHYGFINGGKVLCEISTAELEKACGKRIRVEVGDTKALAQVLDDMEMEYSVESNTVAYVYGKVDVTDFVLTLNERNCHVHSISEHDEDLESFYINLMGGVSR